MKIGKLRIIAVLCAAMFVTACAARPIPAPPKPLIMPEQIAASAAETPLDHQPESAQTRRLKPAAQGKQKPESGQITASPKVELPTTANQGNLVLLRVKNARGKTVSAKTELGFRLRFFADGDSQVALLPIRNTLEPGTYSVKVTVGSTVIQREIAVQPVAFPVQEMTISPATAAETALSAAANEEWETKVEPLKAVCDGTQYWENPFLQPVTGEITTQYGTFRYTNGSTTASRHNGIDIAAGTGTAVSAANNGRVLFAEKLQLTGNTVVIEHGRGLKSFYYHMDSIAVKTDAFVKKGEKIGEVGTTGYSTGPHLHFAMSVNDVFVNPWQAFDQTLYGSLSTG